MTNMLVVLKFDDGSEWQGLIPEPVERYMSGMADEIQRLRDENERLHTELHNLSEIGEDESIGDAEAGRRMARILRESSWN